MAFNLIPMTKMPLDAFGEGFKGVNSLFQQMREHQLKQQQLAELAKYHASDFGLKKQVNNREQQLFIEKLKGLKTENEFNDLLKNAMGMGGSLSQESLPEDGGMKLSPAQQNQQMSDPNTGILSGHPDVAGISGVPAEGQPQTNMPMQDFGNQATAQPNSEYERIKTDPFLRGLFKKKFGVDPAALTPQQLEDYKTGQAGEKAKNAAEGKYMGEAYGKAVDSSVGLRDIENNLKYITEKLEENPNARDVIGPINKSLTNVFGSSEDQQLLGTVMSSTGNIVLDAAKNIKGAFTRRDQTLINSMKPSATDPYYVFVGKLHAMAELTKLAKERSDIYADEIHKGTPPHRALDIAQEKTNMKQAGEKAQRLLRTAEQKSAIQEGRNPVFHSEQEKHEFLDSLSAQERINLLKKVGASK